MSCEKRKGVPDGCGCDKKSEIMNQINYLREEIARILEIINNFDKITAFKIIKINDQNQQTIDEIVANAGGDLILRTSASIIVRKITEGNEVSLRWYISESWLSNFIENWYSTSGVRNTIMQHTAAISENARQIGNLQTDLTRIDNLLTSYWGPKIFANENNVETIARLLEIDLTEPDATSGIVELVNFIDSDYQPLMTAGQNININSDYVISAIDTKYQAGTNITIDNTTNPPTINQTGGGANYSAGAGIAINNNVISNTYNNCKLLVNWSGSLTFSYSNPIALPAEVISAINGKKNRIVEVRWYPQDAYFTPSSTYPAVSTFILPDGTGNTTFNSTIIYGRQVSSSNRQFAILTIYSIFGEIGGLTPYDGTYYTFNSGGSGSYLDPLILVGIRVFGSD